jgi:hypothetical protein
MTPVLLAAALSLGASVNDSAASERRGDRVRDEVAETIVRLLPPQPKPARRFAPVPARPVAVFLEGRLVWIGQPDRLQDLIAQIPGDLLDPEPVLPPWPIDPLEGREICVGTVLQGEFGDAPEIIGELDCDLVDIR